MEEKPEVQETEPDATSECLARRTPVAPAVDDPDRERDEGHERRDQQMEWWKRADEEYCGDGGNQAVPGGGDHPPAGGNAPAGGHALSTPQTSPRWAGSARARISPLT